MLSEERLNKILLPVETNRSATVQELAKQLGASELAIRRALTALAAAGKVTANSLLKQHLEHPKRSQIDTRCQQFSASKRSTCAQ